MFKKGDLVICVEPYENVLTLGASYVVYRDSYQDLTGHWTGVAKTASGHKIGGEYQTKRFRHAYSAPSEEDIKELV